MITYNTSTSGKYFRPSFIHAAVALTRNQGFHFPCNVDVKVLVNSLLNLHVACHCTMKLWQSKVQIFYEAFPSKLNHLMMSCKVNSYASKSHPAFSCISVALMLPSSGACHLDHLDFLRGYT